MLKLAILCQCLAAVFLLLDLRLNLRQSLYQRTNSVGTTINLTAMPRATTPDVGTAPLTIGVSDDTTAFEIIHQFEVRDAPEGGWLIATTGDGKTWTEQPQRFAIKDEATRVARECQLFVDTRRATANEIYDGIKKIQQEREAKP